MLKTITAIIATAFVCSAQAAPREAEVTRVACMKLDSKFDPSTKKFKTTYGCDINAKQGKNDFIFRYTGENPPQLGDILEVPEKATPFTFIKIGD